MDLRLRALNYFIAAAEAGSISEAAEKLNLSQPSISTAIMQIEEALDIQLFIRLPSKGVQLTAQGSEVLKEARRLMTNVEEFRASIGAVSGQMRGDLSVACFLNLGSNYLSEIIQTFHAKYPDITVHIHDLDQQAIFDALASGQVEMALSFDLDLPPVLEVRQVACKYPCAVLPANDPLAEQLCVSMHDLASRPFVLMDLPHTREYFLSLFSELGLSPDVKYRTRTFETVRTFVASGLGVSILNLQPKSDMTYNSKMVVTRPIREKLRPLNITVLHYKRLRPRKIAEAFSDHIADYFKNTGAPGAF